MQKVVLDTNVVVSAVLSDAGIPAKLLRMALKRIIQLHYSAEILAEYAEVLSRPKLNIPAEKQSHILSAVQEAGVSVLPIVSDIQMTDESDRIFYDVAIASASNLITGNMKHYPKEDFITTPTKFMAQYNEGGQE